MIVSGEVVAHWVGDCLGVPYREDNQAIGLLCEGQLVAGVVYEDYTGPNIMAHIRCLPGVALTKDFLRAIHSYPFSQLGVKRITAPVSSSNHQAQQFVTRLGFEEECRLRGYYASGDAIIYVLWKERCRWLSPAENTCKDLPHDISRS